MKKINLIIWSFCAVLSISAQNSTPVKVEAAFAKEYKATQGTTWMNFNKSGKYFALQQESASAMKIISYNNEGTKLFTGDVVSFSSVSDNMSAFLKERFVEPSQPSESNYNLERTFKTQLDNQPVEAAILNFKGESKYLILYFDASGTLIKREILE